MPKQQTISIARPWSTLAIALTIICTFYLNQEWGKHRIQAALAEYLASGLYQQERPLYLDFQARNFRMSDTNNAESFRQLKTALEGPDSDAYAWIVMHDRSFLRYLDKHGKLLFAKTSLRNWKEQRVQFNQAHLQKLPEYRWGLSPEHTRPYRFVSYLLLDTSWMRVLLNVALLCLFAPYIEKLFGHSGIAIWFLAGGVLNGFLYSLYVDASQPILLGAAGACAGLIGVLFSVLAIRPTQAFRSAHHQTLAALALLALFLMKNGLEVWQHQTSTYEFVTQFGTFAICAALCVMLFGEQLAPGNREDPKSWLQNAQFRIRLQETFNDIGHFNFDTAMLKLRALMADYPRDLILARQKYRLEKLQPQASAFTKAVDDYIDLISIYNDYPSARALLVDLVKTEAAVEHNALEKLLGLPKLLHIFIQHNDLRKAEHCYRLLKLGGSAPEIIADASGLLVEEFRKRGLFQKVAQYQS